VTGRTVIHRWQPMAWLKKVKHESEAVKLWSNLFKKLQAEYDKLLKLTKCKCKEKL